MPLSRRDFLARAAAGAAAAALPLGALEPACAPVPARAAAEPISVFTKPLQWMDYTAVSGAAAEAGFDGLDLAVRPGGHVLPERVEEDLPRAVEAARAAGLVVPMITTAIEDADGPHAETIVKTAAALGIGYYRMGWYPYDLGPERDPARAVERLRPRVRGLAELNRRHGVQGAYQNHVGGERVGGPVWDVWLLIREEDPRWIGAQYDIRHATAEGGTTWPLGLELLRPWIRTTDVKDFRWEKGSKGWSPVTVPLGEGMVDFAAYHRTVKELGIRGPVSVHFEYPPLEGGSPLAGAARRREAVAAMKRDLGRLRAMRAEAGL